MVKVYEVDTQYVHQDIAKGKTIMKFVTLQDYEQQSKETEDKIKEIYEYLRNNPRYKISPVYYKCALSIRRIIRLTFPKYFKGSDK